MYNFYSSNILTFWHQQIMDWRPLYNYSEEEQLWWLYIKTMLFDKLKIKAIEYPSLFFFL